MWRPAHLSIPRFLGLKIYNSELLGAYVSLTFQPLPIICFIRFPSFLPHILPVLAACYQVRLSYAWIRPFLPTAFRPTFQSDAQILPFFLCCVLYYVCMLGAGNLPSDLFVSHTIPRRSHRHNDEVVISEVSETPALLLCASHFVVHVKSQCTLDVDLRQSSRSCHADHERRLSRSNEWRRPGYFSNFCPLGTNCTRNVLSFIRSWVHSLWAVD